MQANTTATIEQFLISKYRNETTGRLDGLAVDENGDFLHPNKIIAQCFNTLFENMDNIEFIDDDFKKEFCKRFYFREIGVETFGKFLLMLESVLKTDCKNLFSARHFMKDKSLEKLLLSYQTESDSTGKGNNHGLGILNLTPQDRLNLTVGEDLKTIEYANQLNESHGKNDFENKSSSQGWQGGSYGEKILFQATLPEITSIIFEYCEKLFLQYF